MNYREMCECLHELDFDTINEIALYASIGLLDTELHKAYDEYKREQIQGLRKMDRHIK